MLLQPLTIDQFIIDRPLLLAPMAGVSDAPFREICFESGAGLTVAEMLTSNIQRWTSEKNRLRQVQPDIQGPRMIQIAGSDPGMMSEAAILNQAMGADIIDINMGCPAKKVLQKAAGSALLRNPVLVEKILRAVVAAVDVPVTLKIRTGWCPESRNGVEIARLAEQCGVKMLTVHGRTRQCRFQGDAEYETIARIKRAVAIPVIANGDITDHAKARRVLETTGADGIMIGRSAQGRPWIFQDIWDFLQTGRRPQPRTIEQLLSLTLKHIEKIHRHYGQSRGVLFARKHVSWYTKRCSDFDAETQLGLQRFWRAFCSSETPELQVSTLRSLLRQVKNKNLGGIAA